MTNTISIDIAINYYIIFTIIYVHSVYCTNNVRGRRFTPPLARRGNNAINY